MKNLLNFIYRHNFFFLFLLLEFFCVIILIKNNGYQGSSLFNSSNAISANIYQKSANAKSYLLLKEENEKLAEQNNFLLNRLKLGYAALPLKVYTQRDTLYKQVYQFINGKAINATVNKRNNYITLNIGRQQGVTNDMGVINSKGIIGWVKDVSENFASVMTILHKDAKVNCKLKKDGSNGTLLWEGGNYQYCSLIDIPTHATIKKGDTIVTSSLTNYYPEGILVGFVDSYERRQNESFFTLKVKLSVDFKKINHISVIKNNFKTEKDSLELISQTQSDK